jgi:hypothetical protein
MRGLALRFAAPFFAGLLVLVLPHLAFAQVFLFGDDVDYRVLTQGNYRIVFPNEHESLAKRLAQRNPWLNALYEKEFRWSFDEDAVLVLASNRNQIANGFARQSPRLLTSFFNGGPNFVDEFGIQSWADVLHLHEVVHLYQLNTRQGLSSGLKKVMGNPSSLSIFTYMITPHNLTPVIFMEGNATFNESRFQNGGRLHSGFYRAMFLQLQKHDRLRWNRIMNDRLEWPFGAERYIVGGYLFSHLGEEFGTEAANSFFTVHSSRYLLPIGINATFHDVYNQSYEDSLNGMKARYDTRAKTQRELSGPLLAASYDHASFTRIAGQIHFMINDLQGYPRLCVYPGPKNSDGEFSCRRIRLPFGRVFKYKGELASASYEVFSPTERRPGLFSEGFWKIPAFKDRFVYQMADGHIVYADGKRSFQDTIAVLDQRPLGPVQSSPFLDPYGQVYFFKQQGSRRSLFLVSASSASEKKLFSIDGYYGRVVDVDGRGRIYFTGATPSGTSLFVWDGTKIFNAVESDRVVDAQLVDGRTVLVSEVTAKGFEYRMATLKARSEVPVGYTYQHDFSPEQLAAVEKSGGSLAGAGATSTSISPYRPLRELEFNSIEPLLFGYSSLTGYQWAASALWTDPLVRYKAQLMAGDSGLESYYGKGLWQSFMNRYEWSLEAQYDTETYTRVLSNNEVAVAGRTHETQLAADLKYPLFRTPVWSSLIDARYSYENLDSDGSLIARSTMDQVQAVALTSETSYSFRNALDYFAAHSYSAELTARYEGEGSGWDQGTTVGMFRLGLQMDIFWQTFLSVSGFYGTTSGPRPSFTLSDDPVEVLRPTEVQQRGGLRLAQDFFELQKYNVELKQGLLFGLYHRWIPIGLRRLAPYAGYSQYQGRDSSTASGVRELFTESYYGVNLELLLLHKFPAQINIETVDQSIATASNFTVRAGQAWAF